VIDGVEVVKLNKLCDDRGWLLKMLMRDHMDGDTTFGEIYITVAEPGAIKGQHYHRDCTEWFCVISGKANLVLVDLDSGERQVVAMGDDNMVRVKVPPMIAHGVQNIGAEQVVLLAYADQPYDYKRPDTIPVPMQFDLL
jgi:dTDP-4-dehydrorhamnose 3,5-epimerase